MYKNLLSLTNALEIVSYDVGQFRGSIISRIQVVSICLLYCPQHVSYFFYGQKIATAVTHIKFLCNDVHRLKDKTIHPFDLFQRENIS